MFKRLCFLDQIHLVLQNDDVLQLHDFNSSQVLRGLRLGTSFVSGDEEKSRVHDGGAVQHGGHQDIVSGTVNEGDMTDEFHARSTAWSLAGWVVFLVGSV